MSQYPPHTPDDPTLAYAAVKPPSSALAVTSMILGIIALPTACFGVGFLAGIVAIILGIIALSSINKNPMQYGGKGMAIAGIATGAGALPMFLLLIVSLLPSLGKARELTNRSVCAANVRGIMQSLIVYASDNADIFPVVSPTGGYGLAAAGAGTPDPDPDTTIKSMHKPAPSPSVTQNMWLLVVNGAVAPKQFLCKSDPAPTVTAAQTIAGNYATNFNDGAKPSDFAYSYSFAYPWTATPKAQVGDWWQNSVDASLPLIADMAPFDGTGSPPATPGMGISRTANSFNHQQDGQNVGFADGHCEFVRAAACGQANDNIYAASSGAPNQVGAPASGKVPAIGTGGKPGAFDTCLVPAADAGAKYTRK